MNISQVYQKYQIMPTLAQHQLRVAAVAKTICDNSQINLENQVITSACLLHDMGNIIKFDLGLFPEFLEPQGLTYWQGVKLDFENKYGANEHVANLAIAKDIGVSQKVLDLINSIGFENIAKHFAAKDLAKMICEYADCRVAPSGIVSLEERLKDLELRYGPKYPEPEHKAKRQEYYDLERQAEQYIFENLKIRPEDISEESAKDLIKQLEDFEL